MALCSSASDCALPALVRPSGGVGGGTSELQAPYFPPPNHYFALASSPLFFASGSHSAAQPPPLTSAADRGAESASGANAEYHCRASHAQTSAGGSGSGGSRVEHPYAQQYKQQQVFYGGGDASDQQARKLLAATGAQAQAAAAAAMGGGGVYHNVSALMPDEAGQQFLFTPDIHFRGLYPTRVCLVANIFTVHSQYIIN